MAIKKLFFVLLFLLPVFVLAQTGETRFTQRLTWIGDEYARRYEVEIEKEDEGRYQALRRESTTAFYVEVSLLPGRYRFRVIPYNFLDQPREPSQWKYIEVLAALYPVLDNTTPNFFLSSVNTEPGAVLYEMRVSGKNLDPGAEIFLRNAGGENIIPIEIRPGGGNRLRLFFEEDQLAQGVYELVVINPGGLQTGRSGIIFPPPQRDDKVNLFLSTAWLPAFTVYDEENRFGQMSLAGTAVRFGVVWDKPSFLNPGLELAVSYNFFDSSAEQLHLLAFGLNLSALKWLPGEKTALMFRLGGGYSVFLPDDSAIHVNTGVSFLLFVMNNWYLETGIDFTNWFTNSQSNAFRTWVGIGFNR